MNRLTLLIVIIIVVILHFCSKQKRYKVRQHNTNYTTAEQHKEDIDNMLSTLNAECGICDIKDKYYVMSSILNRRTRIDQPIREIIYLPRQFATNSEDFYPNIDNIDLVNSIFSGINRNYDVLFFYSQSYTDTTHVENLKRLYKRIDSTRFHCYY